VRISNDPEYLRVVMARAGESPEVVLEAAYGWYWAADTLAELGARCIWRTLWSGCCAPSCPQAAVVFEPETS
jgi:hypothetical protein